MFEVKYSVNTHYNTTDSFYTFDKSKIQEFFREFTGYDLVFVDLTCVDKPEVLIYVGGDLIGWYHCITLSTMYAIFNIKTQQYTRYGDDVTSIDKALFYTNQRDAYNDLDSALYDEKSSYVVIGVN